MTMPPQCDEVQQQLSLLLYGELSFDELQRINGVPLKYRAAA